MTLDHRSATETEVLARAQSLVGRRVDELGEWTRAGPADVDRAHLDGVIESYFGISHKDDSTVTFPTAELDLRVVPLVGSGSKVRVKTRTFITNVDYERIVQETWETASVRAHLAILFVFCRPLPDPEARVVAVDIFRPDDRLDALLRADWEWIRNVVERGQAHLLSDNDGRLLTPAAQTAILRGQSQPTIDAHAKARIFALKPSFVLECYRRAAGRVPTTESLILNLRMSRVDSFEAQLVDRFRPFVGMPVAQAGAVVGISPSQGKAYAATVVRRIFGARGSRSRIAEFEEMGLTLRMTRVSPDLQPYEALSFPAFRYNDLLGETWEESDLLRRVQYMLFVPVVGKNKDTPQGSCTLELPLFWRPSTTQLDLIHAEWERFRVEIETGLADRLTPASATHAIHVRPHARDAQDTDDAPNLGPVVKKSFWLNQTFVQGILRRRGI